MFCLHSESFARNKNVWKLQAACCLFSSRLSCRIDQKVFFFVFSTFLGMNIYVYAYTLRMAIHISTFFGIITITFAEYSIEMKSWINIILLTLTHAMRWCPSKFHTNIQKPNSHHLYIGFVLVFATFNSYGVCLCVFLYHLSISLFSYRIWINWSANRFWIVYIST